MSKIQNPKISIKKAPKRKDFWLIGIDEVGRGPLAGPVTVCAFGVRATDSEFRKDFSKKSPNLKLNDSKQLTEKKREEIAFALRKDKYKFFIKSRSAKDIDKFEISVCIHKLIESLLKEFIKSLHVSGEKISEDQIHVLLDGGLKAPPQFKNQETHTKGDAKFAVISCASILAKVYRDAYMTRLAGRSKQMSVYGFEVHKGYGTKKHIEAVKRYGLSEEHRRTFCRNIK